MVLFLSKTKEDIDNIPLYFKKEIKNTCVRETVCITCKLSKLFDKYMLQFLNSIFNVHCKLNRFLHKKNGGL